MAVLRNRPRCHDPLISPRPAPAKIIKVILLGTKQMAVRLALSVTSAILHVVIRTDLRPVGIDRTAPAVELAAFRGEFDVPAVLINEDLNILVQQEPANFVVIG